MKFRFFDASNKTQRASLNSSPAIYCNTKRNVSFKLWAETWHYCHKSWTLLTFFFRPTHSKAITLRFYVSSSKWEKSVCTFFHFDKSDIKSRYLQIVFTQVPFWELHQICIKMRKMWLVFHSWIDWNGKKWIRAENEFTVENKHFLQVSILNKRVFCHSTVNRITKLKTKRFFALAFFLCISLPIE